MKTIELTAELREGSGKRAAKDLRKQDRVPGVIYHNSNATHIHLDARDANRIVFTPDTYIVALNVNGETINTIVRDAQYHPVTEKMLDIELLKVTDDQSVNLTLPLELVGTPQGVSQGGKLTVKLRKVKVKGIPSQLPEKLQVDVSPLELGETIKLGAAELPEGLELLSPSSAAVATVIIPRALRSAKAAAEKDEE